MTSQLMNLRSDLAARFPERKDVIDGALCAVLAGEHVLLLGPPGTAKSALARAIAHLRRPTLESQASLGRAPRGHKTGHSPQNDKTPRGKFPRGFEVLQL